jgi:glycosyltransferase involved in cell wall biosynthesis
MIIPNGVDAFRFSPAASKRAGVSPVCIGSIGRLAPEKNYPLLLRAFSRLIAGQTESEKGAIASNIITTGKTSFNIDRQDAQDKGLGDSSCKSCISMLTPRLLLVGDGSERGHIESVIRELGMTERCTLAGMQSNVLPWLHQMDVFCLPSDTEGLSMTLLEACACGLPCVVTDVGGNAEIVTQGVSGYVVPRGDIEALSVAVDRLIASVELRQQMGQAARAIVEERYSLAAMVVAYETLYANVKSGESGSVRPGEKQS